MRIPDAYRKDFGDYVGKWKWGKASTGAGGGKGAEPVMGQTKAFVRAMAIEILVRLRHEPTPVVYMRITAGTGRLDNSHYLAGPYRYHVRIAAVSCSKYAVV